MLEILAKRYPSPKPGRRLALYDEPQAKKSVKRSQVRQPWEPVRRIAA
jgi:hypothetical protein